MHWHSKMGLLPFLRVWGGHFDFEVLKLRKFGGPSAMVSLCGFESLGLVFRV